MVRHPVWLFSPKLYSRSPPKVSVQMGKTFPILTSLTELTVWAAFSKGEGIKLGCAVTQTFSGNYPLAVHQRTLSVYLGKHSHWKRQSCPSPWSFISTLLPCASTSFCVNILGYWTGWKVNFFIGFDQAIFQLLKSCLSPDCTNTCASPKVRHVWGQRS